MVNACIQMETACQTIHEAASKVVNFQTHFRLRESLSRTFAERLGTRVQVHIDFVKLVIITNIYL